MLRCTQTRIIDRRWKLFLNDIFNGVTRELVPAVISQRSNRLMLLITRRSHGEPRLQSYWWQDMPRVSYRWKTGDVAPHSGVYACAIKLNRERWHGCKIIWYFWLRIIKYHQSLRVMLYFIHTHTHTGTPACTHAVKLICIFKEIKGPCLKLIAAHAFSLLLRNFILFFRFNRWLWCLTLAPGQNRQKIITRSQPQNKTLAELEMSDAWKEAFKVDSNSNNLS